MGEPVRVDLGDGLGAIEGSARPGFEGVVEAFAENFRRRGEAGAAFAVSRDGETLVDLWGGWADREARRPWERNTMQMIFSGTKGICAICVAALVGRGQLSLDDPVASHWPEFAAAGKEEVTVGELMSHRARLPVIRSAAPLPPEALLDPVDLASRLALQAQESDPRARLTYHALTYGWLCGELVRRVDGRSIGRFWREEIADPLGLDVWIGCPPQVRRRVGALHHGDEFGRTYFLRPPLRPDPLLDWRRNPEAIGSSRLIWNETPFLTAEVPGVNAVATARGMAAAYAELLRPAPRVPGLDADAIGTCVAELARGWDELNDESLRFGSGFALQTDEKELGPPADAFGHAGAGGSVHAAWPSCGAGVSYVMTEMRDPPEPDSRPEALLEAAYTALKAGTAA
ncbi:MAG TPA: serine hydrolase domain-containing protein [Solirubrobacterales bacterium]|nr:serine hydrolase domain-containing protein [Solirubrobacterales bacterium]